MTMENRKLNMAVIGCSSMAKQHMKGIIAKDTAHLYAICDINPTQLNKRVEEFHPDVAVTDYKELVDDPNIDAVVVCIPDQLHLEVTEAFLRAGKDVLCEKPMALTMEECEQMMRTEKETGRKLMIGQVCRCTPAFALTKKLIDEDAIGELFFVESEYAHDYSVARGANDWRVTPERHGIIGGGCHAVDLLRWIAGDPTEVFAYANHKCLTDWPVDDCTIAVLQFPNNVAGKVFTSIGCKRDYTMRSVFYGTKGTIICDNTSPTIKLYQVSDIPREDGKRAYTIPQDIPVEINSHNITLEIDQFVDALASGSSLPVTSAEGAKTVAVCRAIVEAARDHKIISVKYPNV